MTSNRPLSYGCWDCVLPHMNFHPRLQIPAFSTLNKCIPIKIHYLKLSEQDIQIDNLVYTKPATIDLTKFNIKVLGRFLEHNIVIQSLKFGFPIFGLSSLKLTVRNLNIYNAVYFVSNRFLWEKLKPFLTESSFPLQSLEISDHSLLHSDVINKSQKLILSKHHCQTIEVNHKRVHRRAQTGIFDWSNNLIAEWIAHEYSIGKYFSLECLYQTECRVFFKNLQHLHGAKISQSGGTRHGYCFTIPINRKAEINVWRTVENGKWIINIRIDPYGTATILEK